MVWLTSLPAWSLVVGFLGVALILATGSRVALPRLHTERRTRRCLLHSGAARAALWGLLLAS